jgi:hypothetical protein
MAEFDPTGLTVTRVVARAAGTDIFAAGQIASSFTPPADGPDGECHHLRGDALYLPSEAAATAWVNAECEPYVAVALRAIAALTLTLLLSGLLSGV